MTKVANEQTWMTTAQAAEYLKLSKRTVQNYISRGAIKVHRSVTGTVRLRQEDLDAFLGAGRE